MKGSAQRLPAVNIFQKTLNRGRCVCNSKQRALDYRWRTGIGGVIRNEAMIEVGPVDNVAYETATLVSLLMVFAKENGTIIK